MMSVSVRWLDSGLWQCWLRRLLLACLCWHLVPAQAALPTEDRRALVVALCTQPAAYRATLDQVVQAVVGPSADDAAWGQALLKGLATCLGVALGGLLAQRHQLQHFPR